MENKEIPVQSSTDVSTSDYSISPSEESAKHRNFLHSGSLPILHCCQLTKIFGATRALESVDLTLFRGRIVGLLGPNGSGKTTLLKTACGLLTPTAGDIFINGYRPGMETKKHVAYLPERTYLNNWMCVKDLIQFFTEFYENFNSSKAYDMLARLKINPNDRLKTMSKGTKEKVQLILVMSRDADLYLLDEPIGGVDPAAREYILDTILTNYSKDATVVISTHLIGDVEKILDDVVFLAYGRMAMHTSVQDIRQRRGKSVDALFREVYRC